MTNSNGADPKIDPAAVQLAEPSVPHKTSSEVEVRVKRSAELSRSIGAASARQGGEAR